ncbi:hypothetical protein GCM10009127_18330 [Alteraurantiacibacter aestuarii]|uniref:class I SAM-dependent methyltransferase n=1 Tax=Alteraurantiacibacter aestuarii TaxID=650004 RepID=UPI0031D1A888
MKRFDDHKLDYICSRAAGRDVLDLGCVNHYVEDEQTRFWLHKALREVAGDLVGLDYLQDAVDTLSKQGYNVVQGNAENFDLGRKFDVIVAGDIVEHLNNQDGFLKSCLRNLKDDGIIVISTPNPWFWKHFVLALLHTEVPNNEEHSGWFCPRTYRQLAARYGLELGEIEFASRYWKDRIWPFPRGWKHTTWMATLRRVKS